MRYRSAGSTSTLFAIIVSVALIALGVWARLAYLRSGARRLRVRAVALIWAGIGAFVGSALGIGAFGGAASGTLLGATAGYAVAYVLMIRRTLPMEDALATGASPPAIGFWRPAIGAGIGGLLGSNVGVVGFGGGANAWFLGAALGAVLGLLLPAWRRPQRPQLQPESLEAASRLGRGAANATVTGLKWAVLLVLLIGGLLVVLSAVPKRSETVQPVPGAPLGQPAGLSSTASHQDPRRSAYDATVRRLEARYPALNPDSPSFNEAVARRVLDRTKFLIQQGQEPAAAVERAADEFLAPPPTAVPTITHGGGTSSVAKRRQDAFPNCVYKPVMTDDEYRACGVRPPSTDR